MATEYLYNFGYGDADANLSALSWEDQKALLGGKGAGLCYMSDLGVAVPPGFIISTEACAKYKSQGGAFIDSLWPALKDNIDAMRAGKGKRPPLLSVRSGARVSMPGMMDTILNVGITTKTLPHWKKKLGPRAALDSYRRLLHKLGEVALGVPSQVFNDILDDTKMENKVEGDSDLSAEALEEVVDRYKKAIKVKTGHDMPDTLKDQVLLAVLVVFRSWNNERARQYRDMNNIPEAWGTAVTIQAMVFGNADDDSGSGVCFTRNPATGEAKIVGEFLPNAQGEDVVAGVRTPMPLVDMKVKWPEVAKDLVATCQMLETSRRDMQDVEFTVESGKLYILQTRDAKRTPMAAFKVAMDMMDEKLITQREAIVRLTPVELARATVTAIDPGFKDDPVAKGLPASGGVAIGRVVTSSHEATTATDDVILVTEETNPDDVGGMYASKGILTRTGGATSHAAVVARAMPRPCITGCDALTFHGTQVQLDGNVINGQTITIDGTTGNVWVGEAATVGGDESPSVERAKWLAIEEADASLRTMGRQPEYLRLHVMVCEWVVQGVAPDNFTLALEDLVKHVDGGGHVVMDLTDVRDVYESDDEVLWDAFGVGPQASWFYLKQAASMMSTKLDGSKFSWVAPYPGATDIVLSLGGKLVKKCTTMADLMADGVKVIDDEFIETVIGGPQAWTEIKSLLEQHDKKFDVLPLAMTPGQAFASIVE